MSQKNSYADGLLKLVDGEGNPLFSLPRYYSEYIQPLDSKFKYRDLYTSHTVLCPLHDDHDPSFGIVHRQGKEIGHCFGCGVWVDVFSLHQKIEARWHQRNITYTQAIQELAQKWGIDLSQTTLPAEENSFDRQLNKERKIMLAVQEYKTGDFIADLAKAKLDHKSLAYVNGLFVRLLLAGEQE